MDLLFQTLHLLNPYHYQDLHKYENILFLEAARMLRNKHPEYKVLYPDDNHIGTKAQKTIGKILISADAKIMGLDNEIAY